MIDNATRDDNSHKEYRTFLFLSSFSRANILTYLRWKNLYRLGLCGENQVNKNVFLHIFYNRVRFCICLKYQPCCSTIVLYSPYDRFCSNYSIYFHFYKKKIKIFLNHIVCKF